MPTSPRSEPAAPADRPFSDLGTAVGPIVLVGMMATGKTTVGQRLAAALGRRVWDSDAMIEEQTGKTVARLWEEGGEPAYRHLETGALEEALNAKPPGIVAAAGGVVLSDVNRVRLQRASEDGAVVIWLRAAPAVLAARVVPGDHRPLLRDDPLGTLTRLSAERQSLYEEVADMAIDVGTATVDEVVATALAEVAAVAAERRTAAGGAASAAPRTRK
jgi:shikimate kinase